MKYLMGLIITFGLGTSLFAQDYSKNSQKGGNARRQSESSAKFREKESKIPAESSGSRKQDSLIRFDNGSAEYTNDNNVLRPGLREESKNSDALENNKSSSSNSIPQNDSGLKEEYTTPMSQAMRPESGGVGETSLLSNQCSLFNELDTRSGAFKDKRKLGDGKLLIKREKDGDERIKYHSRNEFYDFQKNEKGKESYDYGTLSDNEMIQLHKNPDGSVNVYYEGYFPSAEEAEKAITSGLNLNNFGNVCKTNFTDTMNEASADNK